ETVQNNTNEDTNENLNFTRDGDDDYNVFGTSVIDSDSETNDLNPHIV
ncbi:25471_t:CDS:1, partial [Dentiscutata erythropus]